MISIIIPLLYYFYVSYISLYELDHPYYQCRSHIMRKGVHIEVHMQMCTLLDDYVYTSCSYDVCTRVSVRDMNLACEDLDTSYYVMYGIKDRHHNETRYHHEILLPFLTWVKDQPRTTIPSNTSILYGFMDERAILTDRDVHVLDLHHYIDIFAERYTYPSVIRKYLKRSMYNIDQYLYYSYQLLPVTIVWRNPYIGIETIIYLSHSQWSSIGSNSTLVSKTRTEFDMISSHEYRTMYSL